MFVVLVKDRGFLKRQEYLEKLFSYRIYNLSVCGMDVEQDRIENILFLFMVLYMGEGVLEVF